VSIRQSPSASEDDAIPSLALGLRPIMRIHTLMVGEKAVNRGLLGQSQTDDDSGWVDGWDWDVIRWGYFQPIPDWNDPNPAVAHATNYQAHGSFGSSHTSGFNVVLADGSVRMVRFSVTLSVFQSFASRNDGGVVDMNGL